MYDYVGLYNVCFKYQKVTNCNEVIYWGTVFFNYLKNWTVTWEGTKLNLNLKRLRVYISNSGFEMIKSTEKTETLF